MFRCFEPVSVRRRSTLVCSSEAVFTVKRTLVLPDPDVGSRDARVVYIDMYYVFVYVDIYICTYIYVCYLLCLY